MSQSQCLSYQDFQCLSFAMLLCSICLPRALLAFSRAFSGAPPAALFSATFSLRTVGAMVANALRHIEAMSKRLRVS